MLLKPKSCHLVGVGDEDSAWWLMLLEIVFGLEELSAWNWGSECFFLLSIFYLDGVIKIVTET